MKISPILWGLLCIAMGVVAIITGRVILPMMFFFTHRERQPTAFWVSVWIWLLLGVGLVIYGLLHKISN